MATLTKTKIEVKTLVEGYTLNLTKIEAYTLYRILARTGGIPGSSLRGYADSVLDSLIPEFDQDMDDNAFSSDSRLHFTEDSLRFAEDFLATIKD